MAGSRFVPPYGQFVTSEGLPYAGGLLYFYVSGTSTLAETWSDVNLTEPNANPIDLDSAGNAGNVFLSPSVVYKVVLGDSNSNVVWTADPIQPVAPSSTSGVAWGGVSTGAANAQIINATGYIANPGAAFFFVAGFANNGATNLNVNSNNFPAYQPGPTGPVAFVGGELQVGTLYMGVFNPNLNSNAGGYQVIAIATLQALGVNSAAANALTKSSIGATTGAMGLDFGQCYFQYQNATQVALVPQGGAYITIAGVNYSIPSGGVTANPTSCFLNGVGGSALVASTLYYVYAFNNSGTLALDFSTTGHSTDSTAGNVGVEIKTGDNSRSLVGMVFPLAGPVFQYDNSHLLVLSWFNKKEVYGHTWFTTARLTSSNTFTEINSEIRINFLTWANLVVNFQVNGSVTNGTINTNIITTIAVDSTVNSLDLVTSGSNATASLSVPMNMSYSQTFSEGSHYATLLGAVTGGTGSWNGGSGFTSRCTLNVTVKG